MFKDWNEKTIEIGKSKGGVIAVSHPFDNLIKGNIKLWPTPEIVQKMYKSNQGKAFENENNEIVTGKLGYYCDLQSMHSEDSLTWNVFGPVKYSNKEIRIKFVKELLGKIDFHSTEISDAQLWLWRRLPHPDTFVSGGPEIDFGITANSVCIIGEAKWLSGLGKKQGINKDKDQIDIRLDFIKKLGDKTFHGIKDFIVLGLSPQPEIDDSYNINCSHSKIHLKNMTWETICSLSCHPFREELINHLKWKKQHSKMK